MGDVSGTNRSDLSSFQRYDRSRMTIESDKLDFVGLAIFIDVNHCAYVPFFKAFARHGSSKYDSVMFLNHIRLTFRKDTPSPVAGNSFLCRSIQ